MAPTIHMKKTKNSLIIDDITLSCVVLNSLLKRWWIFAFIIVVAILFEKNMTIIADIVV